MFKETNYLQLDITKSQEQLNWNPKIATLKALDLTIDWYNESKKKNNMQNFTINQILNYQNS